MADKLARLHNHEFILSGRMLQELSPLSSCLLSFPRQGKSWERARALKACHKAMQDGPESNKYSGTG
eukprot:5616079-Amphidinium_carterae.2